MNLTLASITLVALLATTCLNKPCISLSHRGCYLLSQRFFSLALLKRINMLEVILHLPFTPSTICHWQNLRQL